MEHKNEKSERAEKNVVRGMSSSFFFGRMQKKNKKVLNLTRTNIDDDDMVWEVAEMGVRGCDGKKYFFFIKTKAAWQKNVYNEVENKN